MSEGTKTGHTPGPWKVCDNPDSLYILADVNIGNDENGGVVQPVYELSVRPQLSVNGKGCVVLTISYESWRQFPSVDFIAMQKANASLIAAAPDLLAALQSLRHAEVYANEQGVTIDDHMNAKERYDLLTAAIAKATP